MTAGIPIADADDLSRPREREGHLVIGGRHHAALCIHDLCLDDDDVLNRVNMEFHRQISIASRNTVMLQTLDVLRELFTAEQRLILAIVASRKRDHAEHLGILEALERRDATLAVERMRQHIEGVVKAVQKWDPEDHPVDGG